MKRILIIGGGFAGLWSALGAARKIDEQNMNSEVEVVLVNPTANHSIRVRNYEENLEETLVPLDDVLDPAGVLWLKGEATDIDSSAKRVTVKVDGDARSISYDRLVLASGSQLAYAPVPGLAEHAFDVDTYAGAKRLEQHLENVVASTEAGSLTAVVIGAGLTGIEIAAELPSRLRSLAASRGDSRSDGSDIRVILADRTPEIATAMGGAQPVIEHALTELGVELMPGMELQAVDGKGLTLADGKRIDASTIVWCGGMRANALTKCLPVEHDALGRVPVNAYMQVEGVRDVFAAGDVARALFDGEHASVMSCQHGRPMGRFAGHNVVCDLLGLPMLSLDIDWYTTILDLGPWGAVYTEGWDRKLAAQGARAKRVKETINRQRIYPPLTRDRAALFDAAAPTVQAPPPISQQKGVESSAEG
ncbi:NAD(P)/FAD-dependent oxidoreductase [Paraburkholderia sp. Cy-641]|uniref:NAD(P)/FAD-dependent oxidoreductase n=1 Tax=Paraburkholderia sp. Cy-641 TaxID=2608337 RepID=UPI00141F6235|nr:FAD-dependent oxidoreductase [Paraburkholderia sp. Cy-641]NIF77325.1 NAD(P)/FAD-dependent oxidoreductase [Paraburkholderia sp. Cy-641]